MSRVFIDVDSGRPRVRLATPAGQPMPYFTSTLLNPIHDGTVPQDVSEHGGGGDCPRPADADPQVFDRKLGLRPARRVCSRRGFCVSSPYYPYYSDSDEVHGRGLQWIRVHLRRAHPEIYFPIQQVSFNLIYVEFSTQIQFHEVDFQWPIILKITHPLFTNEINQRQNRKNRQVQRIDPIQELRIYDQTKNQTKNQPHTASADHE